MICSADCCFPLTAVSFAVAKGDEDSAMKAGLNKKHIDVLVSQ